MKKSAFLLLEVIVAVAILSLGIALLLRSYTTSLEAVKTSKDLLRANLLLEEKIWQKQQEYIESGVIIPDVEEGIFDEPFDNFSYRIDFEELEELASLYKGTFTIFWQRKDTERSVSSMSYFRGKK